MVSKSNSKKLCTTYYLTLTVLKGRLMRTFLGLEEILTVNLTMLEKQENAQ